MKRDHTVISSSSSSSLTPTTTKDNTVMKKKRKKNKNTDTATATATAPAAKRARLHLMGVNEKHHMEAFNLIRQVLEPIRDTTDGVSIYNKVPVQSLLDTAERTWRECVQTNEYKQQPFRYRHKYHVLVVLYAAIKGLAITNSHTTLVEPNEIIKKHLPPFKTLPKRIKDLNISTFTKTNKIFLACMREKYNESEKMKN